MYMSRCSPSITVLLSTLFLFASAYEKSGDVEPLSYVAGDRISVSCLNRTIDTGEHVFDEETGVFQYVPFATCNETGRPLEITFLEDGPLNCTIPFLSDETFHLLEYYVHHDSPLACRVPSRPLGGERDLSRSPDEEYIPLVFALAGKLEASHMHLSTDMNLLFHLSPGSPGAIDSAAAYSTSPHAPSSAARFIIGDALPLKLRIRWHPSPSPFEEAEKGSHAIAYYYCLLSALAGAGVTYAAMQKGAWESSRRLVRRFTLDRRRGGIIGNFPPSVGNGRNGAGAGAGGGGGGGGGYGYSPSGSPANGGYAGYGYPGKRKD